MSMTSDAVQAPIAPARSFTSTMVHLFEKTCQMTSEGPARMHEGIHETEGIEPPIPVAMPLLEKPRHTVVKPSISLARAAAMSVPVERPTIVKPSGVMPLGNEAVMPLGTRGVMPLGTRKNTVVKPSIFLARAATMSLPVERLTIVKPSGVMPLGTREFAVIRADSADFSGARTRINSTDWTLGLGSPLSQPLPASPASSASLPRSVSLTEIPVVGNNSGQNTRHFSKSLPQSRQTEANEIRNFVHRRRETQRIGDD